jgi:mediator of RNA polymerase II transcription subunit 17, fungi type
MCKTATMAPSIYVPVDIVPETKDADDLAVKINQIFVQKGAFRDVAEATLALEPEESNSSDHGDTKAEDDEEETPEQRLEHLAKTREELMVQVHQGAMEITQALDFFSLLLSTHSKTATGTFSPGLKQAVKPGAFDGFVIEGAEMSSTIKPLEDLSKGWRCKGFESAAEDLQAASQRLKKEADRGSSFWQQVAEVGEKGWKVSRHPSATRSMGVHFGLAESAAQFRNKGFAILSQGNDSTVSINHNPPSHERKRLFVTVSRNDQVTGTFLSSTPTHQQPFVHNELLHCRDGLVHQELASDVGREARSCAGQGVVSRGGDIDFAVGSAYHVGISFQDPQGRPAAVVGADDALAKSIALGLQALFIGWQRSLSLRRNSTRPVMTLRPTATPESAVLRPLIASLRHADATATMQQSLDELLTPLNRASVPIDTSTAHPQPRNIESHQHFLFTTNPQHTTITITLPSKRTSKIDITTYLGRPQYGTRYTLTTPSAPYPTPLWHTKANSTTSTTNPTELLSAFTRLLNIDLATYATEILTPSIDNTKFTPSWNISRGPDASGSTLLASEDGAKTTTIRLGARTGLLLLQEYEEGTVGRTWAWSAEEGQASFADAFGEI